MAGYDESWSFYHREVHEQIGGFMEILTPIRAIRAKCRECCNDSIFEARHCEMTDCPLWPYRLGHRPKPDEVEAADWVDEL